MSPVLRIQHFRPVRWLSILVLSGLASCASAGAKLDRPLPFRVALMPVTVEENRNLRAATPASVSEDLPQLVLEEADVTAAIVDALKREGFTDVYPLATDASVTETLSEREKFEHWMGAAAKSGADILLQVRVDFEPNIDGGINEKFWLNLPLFLLGGPFCYFINDRTYEATATMQAEFFSVLAPAERESANVFSIPLQADYTGSQLDFTDRAGKNLGAYGLSLLVPAGLLARSNERIATAVQGDALEELSQALVQRLADQKNAFKENHRLAQFSLDLDTATARRTADGKVALSATVTRQSRLTRYEVRCANAAGPLAEGDLSKEKELVLRIAPEFPVPANTDLIQLEIEDGNENRRSYTFRVEPTR